jgi:hypothetical protein
MWSSFDAISLSQKKFNESSNYQDESGTEKKSKSIPTLVLQYHSYILIRVVHFYLHQYIASSTGHRTMTFGKKVTKFTKC